jgi:hypothetical protein
MLEFAFVGDNSRTKLSCVHGTWTKNKLIVMCLVLLRRGVGGTKEQKSCAPLHLTKMQSPTFSNSLQKAGHL